MARRTLATVKTEPDVETITYYARVAVYGMRTAADSLAHAGAGDQDDAETIRRQYAVATDFWFTALKATANNLEVWLGDREA